jgi:biotin carboxyl carrier protein
VGELIMEFKVGDQANVIDGELIRTLGGESILIKINGIEHNVRLLKSSTDEIEFMLDHSFHYAKILGWSSSEIKTIIDGQVLTVKKHSKLTEILEKFHPSFSKGENNLTSQIPGRVVSILAKAGSAIKKGDAIVILESMKMQVAVKAHRDGNIKEIKAKEGSTVARYDIIAIIE